MNTYQRLFDWPNVHLQHFYIYFVIAAIIACYLVLKGKSKYKVEMFFFSFYLLTGNINELLTIVIPGFSLFEIKPVRFIFLVLLFIAIRKTLLSRTKVDLSINGKIPWFEVALIGYVVLLIISLIANSAEIGSEEVLKKVLDAIIFIVIILALQIIADQHSYDLIGKSIIIGAVLSSIVSLIQLSIDPYFLRVGDDRVAFAGILRSNGIFDTEYFNSYYLIIAISWTINTVKNNFHRIALVVLFSLGVLSTFQRMSWIILALVIFTYLIVIKKVCLQKMLLAGLSVLAIILTVSIFYYKDIVNSAVVQERLSNTIEDREGYYTMVLDNIGDRPLFGFGNLQNEVYYVNMLRITGSRKRASAASGDLHSGYFSALYLYGIPACICFIFFVVLSVRYYSGLYHENPYYIIALLVGLIYLIGNLTNTFLFLKYISVLYAIHIGMGLGIRQLKTSMHT